MASTRSSRYGYRRLGSILKAATSFLGHHISATFELRAGVVKARRPAAAGRSEAKSLDEVEHNSTLSM